MPSAEEFVQRVIDAHRFDKDARFLVVSLVRQHRASSLEMREALTEVYRGWLLSADTVKAGWAIDLIQQLALEREVPLLQRVLDEVKTGKGKLPRYFQEFLTPVIEDLSDDSMP